MCIDLRLTRLTEIDQNRLYDDTVSATGPFMQLYRTPIYMLVTSMPLVCYVQWFSG